MTAALPRRSVLSLLGLAPAAAAAATSPASALGAARLFPGARMLAGAGGSDFGGLSYGVAGVDVVDRGGPVLPGGLDQTASTATTVARIETAIATHFPPEIAAYRSFAPHLKRRLFR